MVTVAIAGGTGGLGFNILQGILETKKHKAIVLSRSARPDIEQLGATVKPVDYSDHEQLVIALQRVHTVISVITALDLVTSQQALLKAAQDAGVKRFAPSEFGVTRYDLTNISLFAPKVEVWKARRASGLECTRFISRLFTNLLGVGTPKGDEEARGDLRPWTFIINVKAGAADCPEDGSSLVTLTTTKDIGRFVAASLGLEKWEECSCMAGETLSSRDMVAKAERVTKRKYLTKNNSVEEMKQQMEEQPSSKFYNEYRITLANGHFLAETQLNKLCPHVKPMTVDEYLEEWWADLDLPAPAWEEPKLFGSNNLAKS